MPSSRSKTGAALALWAGLLLAGGGVGCDELNPAFDPDGGPVCAPGERRCSSVGGVPEVCQSASEWTALPACWTGSGCVDGTCQPTAPFERCEHMTDCTTVGDECTVFVDPDQVTALGTFCVAAPVSGGRPGGQACALPGDCASGWCFRRVCFEACGDISQCTNSLHECAILEVTVDGVQDGVHIFGCVPSAN